MRRGFTLLETLLVVTLMAVIGGVSVPVYQSFQVRNDLDIAADAVVQSLHAAQASSWSVEGDSAWGVKILLGGIAVFKGASYAARDAAYDAIIEVPSSVAPSGTTEFVFAKLTGLPGAAGDLTLSASGIGETRVIGVNAKGTVSR